MICDIDPIIGKFAESVEAHCISPGRYSRYTDRMIPDPYGCADAINTLYTIGRLPRDAEERRICAEGLMELQNPQTGLFHADHHPIHTTAHCTAALELLDAFPRYPFYELLRYNTPDALIALLESLDWVSKKSTGHIGAGIYAANVITGAVGSAWRDAYFSWLTAHCDPRTGFWWDGKPVEGCEMSIHMGDGFHFMFNYEYEKRRFPYPDAMIDTCLSLWHDDQLPSHFGRRFHFTEIDWVFCLNRASRQTSHRYNEIKEVLARFAEDTFLPFLAETVFSSRRDGDDMHMVFGVLCCLAELQSALPGMLPSSHPLHIVLDRRPFI